MTNETEEQQIEALKRWWSENGSSIITGVLIGLAVLFGGKAWFAHQQTTAENASLVYAQMMDAISRNNAAVAGETAGKLIADYTSTPYSVMAAMALAKLKLDQGETAAARTQLEWALENTKSDDIRYMLRLRLARVLLADNDPAGAETLLEVSGIPESYVPLFEELRGDAQLMSGKPDQARAAYEKALATLPGQSANRPLLQIKYDNLHSGSGGEGTQ